jgi:hypothetical protein
MKNNYSKDYKIQLERSDPELLSQEKIRLAFHRVPDLLDMHLCFRMLLGDAASNWGHEERIGHAFNDFFSDADVLNAYCDFIGNVRAATDYVKLAAKRKREFDNFLKSKQTLANDR